MPAFSHQGQPRGLGNIQAYEALCVCVTSCVYSNSTHSWGLQGGNMCEKVIGSATEMSAPPDQLFPKFETIFRQKQGTAESLAATQVSWWQPWQDCLNKIKTQVEVIVSVFQTEDIRHKSRFNNVQVAAWLWAATRLRSHRQEMVNFCHI